MLPQSWCFENHCDTVLCSKEEGRKVEVQRAVLSGLGQNKKKKLTLSYYHYYFLKPLFTATFSNNMNIILSGGCEFFVRTLELPRSTR